MDNRIADTVEIVGMVLAALGIGLIYLPAGIVAAGAMLVFVANYAGKPDPAPVEDDSR